MALVCLLRLIDIILVKFQRINLHSLVDQLSFDCVTNIYRNIHNSIDLNCDCRLNWFDFRANQYWLHSHIKTKYNLKLRLQNLRNKLEVNEIAKYLSLSMFASVNVCMWQCHNLKRTNSEYILIKYAENVIDEWNRVFHATLVSATNCGWSVYLYAY